MSSQLPASLNVQEEALRLGLKELRERAHFLGRWQILGQNPTILCDSAHNEAGLKITLEGISKRAFHHLHVVLGMVSDKDAGKVLRYFPKEATYYFAKPDVPRGLDARELQSKATSLGLKGNVYHSVKAALQAAMEGASQNDLIYVGGSIFVVAEVV